MGHRHQIRIRYGEVDRQGVAYNSHYLTYIDETLEEWVLPVRSEPEAADWDMMLKKATIDWVGSVGHADLLDVEAEVTRWGRTSWQVHYRGSCQERAVFEADVVYVSIELGPNTPVETPMAVRAYLGGPGSQNPGSSDSGT